MTIGEILRKADGINYRMKIDRQNTANFDYIQVALLGKMISQLLGDKKKFPTMQEAYPGIFEIDEEAIKETKTKNSIANFRNFANA